jgi:Protein of unknown function (DUF1553)/Protein of unknown function (DUF1549)/Planctomycete cytochrome C
MIAFLSKKKWLVLLLLVAIISIFTISTRNKSIDFNSQVKPIFNKKCIICHGGVRRKGGFSVLFRSEALDTTESGKLAIIPGDPDHSELVKRITNKDPEERMPYKHPALSDEEVNILKKWIKEGAQWGNHWAYVAVKPVEVPHPKGSLFGLLPAKNAEWPKNEIDYFILDKLRQEKMQPSPEADKATLLRRVSLDLLGIPAPERLAKHYLADSSSTAYENLVDSLLVSPHFGERWTSMWMDLARYADTKGYERDDSRSIWRYRDWLIQAFNEDKPYDQFLTEQIAGDLLPNPTDDQYIATAFHRNTMTNDEGGTDNEEFRTAAVLDRVNTTWEAVMGTTFGCVQCHSHPYDPFTHDEYYKFVAFFNDSRDEDTYADYPLLRHFNDSLRQSLNELTSWLKQNVSVDKSIEINRFLRTWQPAINSLTADPMENSALNDTKWLIFRNHALARMRRVDLDKKNTLIFRYAGYAKQGTWKIHLDKPDGPILKSLVIQPTKDWTISSFDFMPVAGVHDLYLTYESPQLKKPTDNGMEFDWFYFTEEFPGKDKSGYEKEKDQFWKIMRADVPTTPVMMDNPADMHRTTNVFERGNWLVKGKQVEADVPHSLNPMPADAPHNRMGLARWLTSKENPLTARTLVNRLWEQLFGAGLVETLEDLGTQGAPPSHKELLDALAWKFMNEDQWSVKKLLKEMVLSATYRQDSKLDADAEEKDPFNKYYGRGPRVRLSAEQVRDEALTVSGLLNEKLKGPSVMPYQPGGIWLSPWNGQDWEASAGSEKYRRALYTYWKRTAPYPSMITFDGAAREVCTARRIRTNTPLQALVMLNDETYLDAARNFAYRMQSQGGNNVSDEISAGYELTMYKKIAPGKLKALEKLYEESFAKLKQDPEKACAMIGMMNEHNNPQTAALVVVANAMLNLDEWVTKN